MKTKILSILALLLTVTQGAWAETGMTNGLFSVSATKRVYFSKGNLQYDGTNWKFAASQWEVLGANGTGATGTATNYPMDLFTWGNIDSPTYNGTTYYTENADLSGITDWGSRMGSGWYTLSKDEWLYLFGMESNNTDKSGHARYRKYFRARVNGVSGIVVLPDDLSGISDIPAESSRGTASTFNGKTYTTDAWSAMESAGCVFLPAAGFRNNGTSVSYVGSSGFYWPSTANGSGSAFTVGFDSGNVFPANNFNRNLGFSVRLVIDGITLDKNEAQMTIGNAMTLTATVVTPTGDKTVTWTTSDASVATVTDGVVTAVAAGTATITATATNGTADTSDDVTATCTVNVYPWAGSGTADDPFQIQNVDDWNTLAANVTGGETYSGIYFKMTDDIIGVTTRTGKNSVNPFSGTFDGQGHTMNLNIYTTTTDDVTSAPFGYISGATIKNLHITGSETTTAYMRAASIAGFAANSTITNCWSEVALTSGYNKDIDCGAFVATVIASSSLTLNGCLFTGTITYTNDAGYEGGGMVGWTRAGGTATLNDCVFAPAGFTVTNYSDHYMFVGGKNRGVLNNCYYNDVAAATSLTKEGKQARNIIAGDGVIINGLGAVTTTYDVSGIAVYGKGLKYGDTFCAGNSESVTLDLNFSKTGCVVTSYTASGGTLANPTSSGPTLTMPDADVTIGATYRECAGTEADPYLITSTADWNTLSANVDNGNTYSGVYFSQTKNISVTTTLGPSTTNNSYKPFGGIYDGNGMTLDVTLNGSGECTAPFGCIQGATIKNLHITGSISTTGLRPASIASFCENSTITNCWSEVAISSSNGSDIDGGAFVGRVNANKSLTLNGCLFTGSITYSNANGFEGGGMVGYTQTGSSATLNNCVFAPSAISIQKYSGHNMFVGGKVLGTLTNCYYNDVAAASSLTKQAKQMRSITAGTDVTSLVISGDGTEYDVSAITAYATGLKYNDVYYAGSADNVSLTLSHGDAATGYSFDQYTASAGTLSGTTLTMPDADVTINATWTENTATLTALDEGSSVASLISEWQGKQVEVSFTRSFTSGVASTICLPFPMTSIEGGTVYEFVGVTYDNTDGWVATMSDATPNNNNVTSTTANKPYLFMPNATGDVTFTGTIASVPASITAGSTTSTDWTFYGTYTRLAYGTAPFSNTVFGFAASTTAEDKEKGQDAVTAGEFVKAISGAYIPAFRAFLTYEGTDPDLQARGTRSRKTVVPEYITVRLIGKNGDVDAIGEISLSTGEVTFDSNAWYDLSGRKLAEKPTQRGIYINGNKKVVLH